MILVLSGTKDGRIIIEKLIEKGYKVLATTATEYGGALIKEHHNLKIISKRLTENEMKHIIKEYGINCIIDATHPYAKEVSKNAINASKKTLVKYIRYERSKGEYEGVRNFKSFKEAADWLKNKQGNILLTIGSNNLEAFVNTVQKERLYIRLLPMSKIIKKCEDLGLLPKQILGMQGPFSKELNIAIYSFYNIKYLVTKDSGDIGGTKEKIESAKEMGIDILLIERPKIKYENAYNNIDKVIENI
ncbi:precorrin-6A reductase [Thermohalobacter berrensis]|uniref:Precorrin-6x reductase n=1 Tax=Thermohalobacter berrensis TaxID=99594 RepID=A0A419SZB1_9FIRM|nr:precorrin-6A reductase [Thermohalobacter berrensis]RKD30603.1 precorrin-6x reductase [Thermohalobacter berrensis]